MFDVWRIKDNDSPMHRNGLKGAVPVVSGTEKVTPAGAAWACVAILPR
jgi:hypothetical protein